MKNYKSIAAVLAMSLLSVVPAKADGYVNPYVGLNATLSRVKSTSRILPGIVVGNAFKFESFYVEPEIKFNVVDNLYKKKRFDNLRFKDTYGLNLNFGYEFIDNLSFFANISENYMQIKANNFNKHKFAFGYGFGFKYDVFNELSLNVKFDTKEFKKSDMKATTRQLAMGIRYNF